MKMIIYDKENFLKILKAVKCPDGLDLDFLYDIYSKVSETINGVISNTEGYRFNAINPITVILYLIHEYTFFISGFTKEQIESINKDEGYIQTLTSTCADKYLTNEQLSYNSKAYLNKFNPFISTITLYLNFALRSLDSLKNLDTSSLLVCDMLKKAFTMAKCIINLLIDGFETEAFSTWRTLHENESILICLIKYNIFQDYLRHVKYALAYRKQIKSVEQTDKIFEEIKENMKKHELKSKDMKKYIEYGYLFSIPNIKLNEDFKLNFRDGVEKLAGLERYSKIYEMSSEISHSSPLLLFSNKEYYYLMTVSNLYESFFRLEAIFDQLYKKAAGEAAIKNYEALKDRYLRQIQIAYTKILQRYNALKRNKTKQEEVATEK